jgi:hypothetical protein
MHCDIRIPAVSPDRSVIENERQQAQRKRREMNEEKENEGKVVNDTRFSYFLPTLPTNFL